VKDFLERVPLHRLLSVLQVPYDGFAHTGEFRQLGLGQPRLLAVALDELGNGNHYCFNGKKCQKMNFSRLKQIITDKNYCLRGNYGVFFKINESIILKITIITVKTVIFDAHF
jgi:hypothetical protein